MWRRKRVSRATGLVQGAGSPVEVVRLGPVGLRIRSQGGRRKGRGVDSGQEWQEC